MSISAIAITAAEVKEVLVINVTTYDTMITNTIASIKTGLLYDIDATYAALNDSAFDALIKRAFLEIIAGECLNSLRRQLGWTEGVSVPGITITNFTETGNDLIKTGNARLKPYTKSGAKEQKALDAEADARKAKADAEAAQYTAQAAAATIRMTNENNRLDAEHLEIEAKTTDLSARTAVEVARVEAETDKTVADSAKVAQETLASVQNTAVLTARAAIEEVRKTQLERAEAAINTDLPQGSTSGREEDFSMDASAYTLGGGEDWEA